MPYDDFKSSGTITAKPNTSGRNPYPHQRNAINNLDELDKHNSYSTLLVLPTGGGKTYTASTWLLTHALDEGKKIFWMAHRHLLLDQAAESFGDFAYKENLPNTGSFDYRIISGAHESSWNITPNDDLLIVGKDSITRNLNRLDSWLAGEKEVYLIIDEAHHAAAKGYRKIIDYFKDKVDNLKIIGLTATPTRTAEHEQRILAELFPDGVKNGQFFNNAATPNRLGMVYKIGLQELIQAEILSKPVFIPLETHRSYGEGLGLKALQSIQYRDKLPPEIERAIARDEGRNKLIVETYKKDAAKYGKTLVFTVSIEHTKILTQRFNDAGIKAAYVVSGTPHDERERIYNAYRHGNLQVIVNVQILTEGTDLPMTQTIFLARPTTSTILMTQMVGRGLRGPKAGGTEFAYIVSFVDSWKSYIMWVVPETIYYDEIIDPDSEEIVIDISAEKEPPTPEETELNYISQAKILEFAQILNEAIDTRALEALDFIERIPIGMYAFSYERKDEDKQKGEQGSDISYQIMVYNSTKDAYAKFMADLPEIFKEITRRCYKDDSEEELSENTLERLLKDCKEKYFSGEMIPPYNEEDIVNIIKYYAQTGICPQLYTFAHINREKLDVAKIAQEIFDKDMGERAKGDCLKKLWDEGDKNILRMLFTDQYYFDKMIEIELRKLRNPELYAPYKKTLISTPPAILPPADNFQAVDKLFEQLANSTTGKAAIKNNILNSLEKIKNTALQNKDAAALKTAAIYYGKIHEHGKADECENLAENLNGTTSAPTNAISANVMGTNFTWTLDAAGTLTISGKGYMKNWDNEKNPAPWYGQREEIEKIVIKDGVKSIGDNSFEDCFSLTSIIIPDSVTKIGEWAFSNCESLNNVVIPNSVKLIGQCAFFGCVSLTNIALPDNVTIEGGVFVWCNSLKKINQPSKVIFYDNLFVYEKKAEGLEINSFIGTETVSSVVIPDSVTSISDLAFSFCELLTSVRLPPSIKKIGNDIFSGCEKLQTIHYKRGLYSASKLGNGNNAQLIPY